MQEIKKWANEIALVITIMAVVSFLEGVDSKLDTQQDSMYVKAGIVHQ